MPDQAMQEGRGGGDIRPIPDPTRLTTEQLNREIASLREILIAGQLALKEIIETRMAGNDRAITLLQATADKFPGWVDEKIHALKDVHEQRFVALTDTTAEKFLSIQTQFAERDVRTAQAAGAVKIAVDAALQAQKEAATETNKSSTAAITKSEAATTKQIDQLGDLIRTTTKGSDDKFTDVKERLTRIEGTGEGGKAMWAYVAGAVALAASLYFGLNHLQSATPASPPPQVIYVPAPNGTQLPVTPPGTVPR